MKIYILYEGSLPYSENAMYAALGFTKMGYEVIPIYDLRELDDNKYPEDIVFAGIGNVLYRLETQLGLNKPEEICYPEELNYLLGRKVEVATYSDIVNDHSEPSFIKPYGTTKYFNGCVVEHFKDLPAADLTTKIYKSELVNFVTEYRCFILRGKIMGAKHYKGDFSVGFDRKVLEEAVEKYTSAPIAYSLDLGVDKQGRTLLVECNDSHSMGHYGLNPSFYTRMISARWAQMTNTKDYLEV